MAVLKGVLRVVLLPVAVLYAVVTEIRNFLFDWKVLPIYRSQLPVISVGNLVVGGTGKTPFTIWLAKQLATQYKVAIVSRGYRRKSKGMQIVAREGQILLKAQQAGDEPLLMAKKVTNATVVVAEKRAQAVQWIEQNTATQVVLLDDGFQHRFVERDVDLVLFNNPKQLFLNFMLPTGSWRELPYRLQRADFVGVQQPGQLPFVPSKKQFNYQPQALKLVDIHFKEAGSLTTLVDQPLAAFAGLAQPQKFFRWLKEHNINPRRTFAFADHHWFTIQDLRAMLNFCQEEKLKYLVCTEKDLVKIQELLLENSVVMPRGLRIVAPEYMVQPTDERLLQSLKKTIDKKLKSYYIRDSKISRGGAVR